MFNIEQRRTETTQTTASFQTRVDLKFQMFLELFLATVVEAESYSVTQKADTIIDILQKKNKLQLH